MIPPTEPDVTLPRILRETFAALVRRDGSDLTARQFAVLLICYVEDGPHTVRGLAERTQLPKPAISRVLDRLGALGLTRRVADPRDKRSVLVACTAEGFAYLRLVRDILAQAAETVASESGSASKPSASAGAGG
jgi:DNA-binding MarR family transcriptional regulator